MFRFIVPALCLLRRAASRQRPENPDRRGHVHAGQGPGGRFRRRTGDTVTVVSDTAGGVQKRMEAGETFDLVIGTERCWMP